MGIKAKSQADRRRMQHVRDQHGRRWAGTIEIDTGAFCSPLLPVNWNAPKLGNGVPLLPPMVYFKFDPMDPGGIIIDYERWLGDVRAAEQAYDERRTKMAAELYRDGAAEVLKNPTKLLLESVGPGPIIGSAIVEALAAGNQFALGLSTKMPSWAEPFFRPVVRAEPTEALRALYPDAEDELIDASIDEALTAGVTRNARPQGRRVPQEA